MAVTEFVLDDGVVLIEDRVVEAFGDAYMNGVRIHVRNLGFEVFAPDRHGAMEVRIGIMSGGSPDARIILSTTDQAARDALAVGLEAARQRGLAALSA